MSNGDAERNGNIVTVVKNDLLITTCIYRA